jgi:WD40 repeat protein
MTTAGSKRPREQHAPATNGLTVLHRSRLVPWNVAAVTSVAACPDGSVFAAGYDDGKVEVFDATLFTCLAVSSPGSMCMAGTAAVCHSSVA